MSQKDLRWNLFAESLTEGNASGLEPAKPSIHFADANMKGQNKLTRRNFLKLLVAGGIIGGLTAFGIRSKYQLEQSSREFNSTLYPPQKLHVGIKGICYSVGTHHPYRLFDCDMKKDIENIHDKLGCNGMRIYGNDEVRLIKCANMAIEKNFDKILLLPFYEEATGDQLINKVGKIAKEAEKLRREYGNKIEMMIGNELSVTSSGIYPGKSYLERSLQILQYMNDETRQKKLTQLLRDLIAVSRAGFDGRLCYGAGSWEWMLPWDELDLDILGDQHYWYEGYGNPEDPNNEWFNHIKHYKKFGKPYYNTEFGSGCYKGAFELGGGAWMPERASQPINEDAQTESIKKYMEMFNKADTMGLTIEGCFLFRYFGPNVSNDYDIVVSEPVVDHIRRAYNMYESWQMMY